MEPKTTCAVQAVNCPRCHSPIQTDGREDTKVFCHNCGCVPAAYSGVGNEGDGAGEREVSGIGSTSKPVRSGDSTRNGWLEAARPSDQCARNLRDGLAIVFDLAGPLGLPPSVMQRTAELVTMAFKRRLTRGRPLPVMVAALTCAAARERGIAVAVEEVASLVKADNHEVGRTFRRMSRELGIRATPTTPEQHLARTLKRLGLSVSVAALQQASAMLEVAMKDERSATKSPAALASAVAYMALSKTGQKATQRQVAYASSVTENTVRCTCRLLEPMMFTADS